MCRPCRKYYNLFENLKNDTSVISRTDCEVTLVYF